MTRSALPPWRLKGFVSTLRNIFVFSPEPMRSLVMPFFQYLGADQHHKPLPAEQVDFGILADLVESHGGELEKEFDGWARIAARSRAAKGVAVLRCVARREEPEDMYE